LFSSVDMFFLICVLSVLFLISLLAACIFSQ
jgi:hypothetical protein